MERNQVDRWLCSRCGSDEVEGLAWVRLKDEKVQTWNENDERWCPNCQDHGDVCQVNPEDFCETHEQPLAACKADHNDDAPIPGEQPALTRKEE